MSRNIDAESLYKRIDNHLEKLDVVENRNPYDRAFIDGMREVLVLIADEPTIEVVKHGKWEKCGYKWECSVCKARINIDGTPKENNLWFCSNCGAKMESDRGEVNDF